MKKKRWIATFVLAAVLLAMLAYPALAEWSTDPAVNTPVVTASGDQGAHRILYDDEGGYFVVWKDQRGGNGDIYAQYFDAAGEPQWGENGIVVCDATGIQEAPKVAPDEAGGIIVSWQDNRDANYALYAQLLDASGAPQWTANGVPVIASADDSHYCGWIVPDGAHGAIVMSYSGAVNRVAANGTLPWGTADSPVIYGGFDGSSTSSPKLIEDGAGGAILTWAEGLNTAVQRVDANGDLLWNGGSPVMLSTSASDWCPRIVSDGAGGAVVIWQDSSLDVRAQKVNGSGVPQWTPAPDGILVTGAQTDDFSHGLASDGAGGALVTWFDTADNNLYAQRIGSGGTLLWTSPAQLTDIGDYYDTTDSPRKTMEDGSGGFITVWVSSHPDTYNLEVRAQRADASGNPLWTDNGVVLSNIFSTKNCPRLAGNGQGGAVAVWKDYRATDWDIYMQGVGPDGALSSLAPVRYVKYDASGSNDGSSWADAYPHLQDALGAAQPGDEIWVAAGVYYPDEGVGQMDNHRAATFTLRPGVALYGGFAGTETTPDDRNWTTNVTVLSGDIDGDDGTDPHGVVTDTANITGTNAYHVVTGGGVTETSRLDGFTVTAGCANGTFPESAGGGMYNASSSPTLVNVTFSGNYAAETGAGMYNHFSSPQLTNVTFSGNYTDMDGGGMSNNGSSPMLTGVAFTTNKADHSGGGMLNFNSSPKLSDIVFTTNEATNYGGGMANFNSSSPALINVTFSGNQALEGGGMFNDLSSPTLTNVDFTANDATNDGGGMYNTSSSPTLTNVTFIANDATGDGGGMYNTSSSPTLTNVTFTANDATGDGGGMYNELSSPTLTNVTFGGNYAAWGGGMHNHLNSSPTLTNVTFGGNYASSQGGGMYNNFSSNPTVINAILWGNVAGTTGDEIYDLNDSLPIITYSDVGGGWTGSGGTGNIDADPLFVAPVAASSAPTTTGDYHLQATSPAVDSGSNDAVAVSVTTDLDGKPRIVDGDGDGTAVVDMGAYELQATIVPTASIALDKSLLSNADVDDDGQVSLGDTLTYQFVVTNTGDVTLDPIVVSDPLPGLSAIACDASSLAPHAHMTFTATYTVTQADVDAGQIDNTATATGTDPDGVEWSDEDSEAVIVPQHPSLSLLKSGAWVDGNEDGYANVGEIINYAFTVTNTGNVTLHNVTVTDTVGGVVMSGSPITLAVGAVDNLTFTATYTVTQVDIDAGRFSNTATADSDESGPVSDDEDVSLPQPQNASLSLLKSGSWVDDNGDGYADVGEIINYAFTVTNTGNVTLHNVTVTDTVGGVIMSGSPITLTAGAVDNSTFTATYTITQADIDAGHFSNTATADSDESEPVSDDEDVSLPQHPSGDTIKVAQLTGSSTTMNKNFWKATVLITVEPALEGAVVSGTWSDGTAFNCTTDVSGECTAVLRIGTETYSIALTVDDVALAGYEYDSSGVTTITVENTAETPTMKVTDLNGSSTTVNQNFWEATVLITVEPALEGAVVSGTWSDGTAFACTTDASGQCTAVLRIGTETYSIALTVNDVALAGYAYDPNGVTTITVENAAESPTIKVADLTSSSTTMNKNFWKANILITVEPAVEGAVVSGTWSDGTAFACTTDTDGQCTATLRIGTDTGEITLTVDNVALAGYAYDSSGMTTVTVNKP